MARSRFLPDNFTLLLVATVAAASVLPCRGEVAQGFGIATQIAIGLLFFLHGAQLSREAVVAGLSHWRLHVVIFSATFVMFPLFGLALRPVLQPLVTPDLYTGLLFLCALPATVQSAIAFTSMARGNVPAAVCSASASSLLGIVMTPALVGLLLSQHTGATASLDAVRAIVLQLLVPFAAGQLLRPWIGVWIARHKRLLSPVDRGSILLVVYTAFSEAVIEGLWQHLPLRVLAGLLLCCAVLLALALVGTTFAARRLGFNKEDEIAIVFCGSKKSLASGVPMARVLFASHAVGAVILPLMIFHQLQLMVCAVLAQRYSARGTAGSEANALEADRGAEAARPAAERRQ